MFCVNLKVSLGLYTELGLCPNMILTRLHPNGPLKLIPDNASQVLSTTYLSTNSEGVLAPISVDHSYTKSSLQKVNPVTSGTVNELSKPFYASLGNGVVDVRNKPSQSEPKPILISNVSSSLLYIPLQTNNPNSALSDCESSVKSSVNQVVASDEGTMDKSDAGCLLPSGSEISSVSQVVHSDGEMSDETGCLPSDANSVSMDTSRVEGMNDMSDTGFFIPTKSMLSESGAFINQVTKSDAGFEKLTETPVQESPSPGTMNLSAPPFGRPPLHREKIKYPRQCLECLRYYATRSTFSAHRKRCHEPKNEVQKINVPKKIIIHDCYVPKNIASYSGGRPGSSVAIQRVVPLDGPGSSPPQMLRDILLKNESMRKLYQSTEKKWVPFSSGRTTGYVKALPQKE